MVKLVKRDGIAMPLLADGKGVSNRKSIFCIMVLLMEDHDESDALLYETEDVPLELPYTKCWNTPIEMNLKPEAEAQQMLHAIGSVDRHVGMSCQKRRWEASLCSLCHDISQSWYLGTCQIRMQRLFAQLVVHCSACNTEGSSTASTDPCAYSSHIT